MKPRNPKPITIHIQTSLPPTAGHLGHRRRGRERPELAAAERGKGEDKTVSTRHFARDFFNIL
jgi:hypothetical protein